MGSRLGRAKLAVLKLASASGTRATWTYQTETPGASYTETPGWSYSG